MTWNTQNINIDPKENFIIETSVSLNWDKEGRAYLIFGVDPATSNYHCISIKKVKKNSVYVGKRMDGEWVGVWKNGKIKDFGQQNKLTIKKKKNRISFYVNGGLVHSKDFEPFFGNGVGVGCGAQGYRI